MRDTCFTEMPALMTGGADGTGPANSRMYADVDATVGIAVQIANLRRKSQPTSRAAPDPMRGASLEKYAGPAMSSSSNEISFTTRIAREHQRRLAGYLNG